GNVTYGNGDHGIDDNACTGQEIIDNTVYKNATAGINLENSSTGATVANNISVDNGIASSRTRSDIRVETGSTAGTTLDYDLVYLTTKDTLLIWNSVAYTTLNAFQTASRQELHAVQADPRWTGAGSADFHLAAGSPATDSGTSLVAALPVTPTSGAAPLAVTADASNSTDTDGTPIQSYSFDFGDGTSTGSQAAATAAHAYAHLGT